MLDLLQTANLAIRFGVEIALLVAVGYTAWRALPHRGLRLLATITLPVAVAVVWATVVHGTAVPQTARVGAQLALFAVGAAGLAAVRRVRLATAFATVALVNAGLMAIWAQ